MLIRYDANLSFPANNWMPLRELVVRYYVIYKKAHVRNSRLDRHRIRHDLVGLALANSQKLIHFVWLQFPTQKLGDILCNF